MADLFGFSQNFILFMSVIAVLIIALLWWTYGGPRAYCLNCGRSTRAPKPDQSCFCPYCGEPIFGENLQRQRQQQLQPAAATQPTVQIIQPAQSPQVKEVYRERETVREIVKIRCSHCRTTFDEKLDRCPHCGAPT
jgi:rRNA maturation endonuclease Nob1